MCSACAIRDALFVVLLVLLFASAAWLARKIRRSEHFYTDFTQDEPTRPWVAYTGTVPTGTWTRVACTYDVSAIRVYFDSVEKANASFNSGIAGVSGNLTIGQNEPNGDNFDGLIDEVEIWGSIVAP